VLSLIQKAGWRGRVSPGDKVWSTISTKVYGSEKVAVSYDEYVSWKKGGVETKEYNRKGADRGALG
jgi:hypothetical protein